MKLIPWTKQMLYEYLMNLGLAQIGNAGMEILERMKPGDTETPFCRTS